MADSAKLVLEILYKNNPDLWIDADTYAELRAKLEANEDLTDAQTLAVVLVELESVLEELEELQEGK